MPETNKLKIFNDPIYGFIRIPNALIFDLIGHPYFQRLRRISQMGLSYLVYPGAHHTRFHHALGSMHLMGQAIQVLRLKKVPISDAESDALLLAILMHDIGHGPFSHAMEHSIVHGISHEEISLHFMNALNKEFNGQLDLAIDIFKGTHKKRFLNQLISSQLDMDRLDYLKRDSFYTGVAEGNINAERLISMLNVSGNSLVVEEKGIYSVEKFLMARRFMYWQVYLHKTGIVAEQLLIKILKRAKELHQDIELPASRPLSYFMDSKIDSSSFDDKVLAQFAQLDDIDILSAIKNWQYQDDFVLSELCKMVLNRKFLKIRLKNTAVKESEFQDRFTSFKNLHGLTEKETSYFVFKGQIENTAYDLNNEAINIILGSDELTDVASASDHLNLKMLSRSVVKYFYCYPKNLD
ncbi:MAG: HD domain-containing protein [Flavobacteriaceae bacterium]